MAARHAGITPLWSSEIEPFPCAVTAKHFPEVRQLGDITKLDGAKLLPVDIITAGSPCQDLSVAGKQEGLKGARSGLFRDAIGLVRDMRRATGGRCPRFFVWENVPGAFSSNRGMDFRAVLEEIGEASIPMPGDGRWANAGLVELPECQIAWRVLDAQYWGVPQRRKRIFLVADFAERKRRAGQILFERQSLFRHTAAGGEAREGTSAGAEGGARAASGVGIENDVAGTLDASYYKGQGQRGGIERTAVCVASGNCQTLNARMGMGGNQVPVIAIEGNGARPSHHGDGWSASGKSFTLNTVDRHAVFTQQAFGEYAETGKASAIKQRDYKDATDLVAAVDCRNGNEGSINGTLQAKPNGGTSLNLQNVVRVQKSVRRLTPLECERLQGLPDNYTLIDHKTCSDTARYKALGNGMAQPCANYVIRRIVEVCNAD